eukprot:10856662-Alexandrium_andersonii.AAC.1
MERRCRARKRGGRSLAARQSRKANRKEARRLHRAGFRSSSCQASRCVLNDQAFQGRGTLVRGDFGDPTSIPKKGWPIVEAQEVHAKTGKCDKVL